MSISPKINKIKAVYTYLIKKKHPESFKKNIRILLYTISSLSGKKTETENFPNARVLKEKLFFQI